jgi:hypothetical protein
MATLEQLEIRVNDVETIGLKLRRRMVDGYPAGSWEVLVEFPILGYFPLDDQPDFIIEVKDPLLPKKQRTWQKLTLDELVIWLKNLGVLKV